MKRLMTVAMAIILLSGCEKPGTADADVPTCIKAKIAELQQEAVRNPPASVWQYEYNGQTVYYVPPYCCDMYSVLYDSNCNIICHPDGGITGSGDGRCPDFFDKRKNGKLVWEDNR